MALCGRWSIAKDSLSPFWAMVFGIRADLEAEMDLCIGSADLSGSASDPKDHVGKAGVSRA